MPFKVDNWAVSPRGAGWLFGPKVPPSTTFAFDRLFTILMAQVTSDFIATNNLKLICRAHQLVHEVPLTDQNPDEIYLMRVVNIICWLTNILAMWDINTNM